MGGGTVKEGYVGDVEKNDETTFSRSKIAV